jgi:hypothetical protein
MKYRQQIVHDEAPWLYDGEQPSYNGTSSWDTMHIIVKELKLQMY